METWLKPDDRLTAHQFCPIGYKAISILRIGRTRGGITLVHIADNNIKLDKKSYKTKHGRSNIYVSLSLIHPSSYSCLQYFSILDTSIVQFIGDLIDVLKEYVNWHGQHTILGYFNIQINDENDSDSINFNDFLNTFDLTNKVQFSTKNQHNTIDFIIALNTSNYIQKVKQGGLFSDHFMILFDIMEPTNIQKFNTVAYHKTKAINKEEFSKYLARELNSQGTNIISVKDKITYYNETIMKVPNKHVLLCKKKSTKLQDHSGL